MSSKPGYRVDRDERGLTATERAVLQVLVAGGTQKEAAEQIGVSKQRVSQIVKRLVDRQVLVRDGDTTRLVVAVNV